MKKQTSSRVLTLAGISLGFSLMIIFQVFMANQRLQHAKEDRAERLELKLAAARRNAEDSRLSLQRSNADLNQAEQALARIQQSADASPLQLSNALAKVWTAQMNFDAAQLDQLNHQQATSEALTALNSIPNP